MKGVFIKNKDQDCQDAYQQTKQSLYESGEFSDIVLIAGIDGKRYPCHRFVLSCSSQFFRTMFTIPMRESQQSEIVLNEVSSEQLKPLLAFCYTNVMKVNLDADGSIDTSVKKLLCTASMLLLDAAVAGCVDYLKTNLTNANCLGIYALAEQHSLSALQTKAEKYVNKHFGSVCQHKEFLEMPFELLKLFIASDSLRAPNEEIVYGNMMCWVQHDEASRSHHIPELLKVVRLPLLSQKYLMHEVRPICEIHGCMQLFAEVMAWHCVPDLPTSLSEQQTKKRKSSRRVNSYNKDNFWRSTLSWNPRVGIIYQ